MIGYYILFGGMMLFATAIGILDLVAQHRRRSEAQKRRA